MKNFGTHLMEAMKRKGETITSLSKATKLPVSTLSEWCHGRQPMLGEGLIRLANHLGVSLEQLISGERGLSAGADNVIQIHGDLYRIRVEKISNESDEQ